MMKFKTLPILLFISLPFSAQADVALSQEDLLGAWRVEGESLHRDGTDMVGLDTIWTFRKDGTMEGFSKDSTAHARVGEFRAVVNYNVKNGKLTKQATPGRSRLETCTAVEKEGTKMTLKCESVYFFMTKQK